MTATLPGLDLPPWSLTLERPVLGIDPSTRRMAGAVLLPAAVRADAAFVVSTCSLPQPGDVAVRLAESQALIVPWVGELVRDHGVMRVFVEQPYGKHVPIVSYYTLGVLLAVLATYRLPVRMIQPSSWKLLAMGKGRGSVGKPGPKCPRGGGHAWPRAESYGDGSCLKCGHAAYGVLSWARANGYTGTLYDEADAVGIATAGGVLLDREVRAA